jgi:hypothetical protein
MEAIGLAASIIAVIQAAAACQKLAKKLIGPSQYSSEELQATIDKLGEFINIVLPLQTRLLQIDSDDEASHQQVLSRIPSVVDKCKVAIETIDNFLQNSSTRRMILGTRFDKKLKTALTVLDDSKAVFLVALQVDD